MAQVEVTLPISSPRDLALVFPYDIRLRKFDREFYNPAMTNHKFSFDQIDKFLNQVDEIVSYEIRKVKNIYFLFMLAAILLFLCVTSTVFGSSATFYEKAGFIVAWILVIGTFITLVSKYIKKRFQLLNNSIEALAKNYVSVFNEQGYRWKFKMKYPGWMELIKEEKVQIDMSEPYPQQCKSTATILDVKDDRETNESTVEMN